ncbi:acyltransferase [Sediminicola luteus]|uniref:Acyltransferase n=1 Tax=Sediminicola luteus TaxID=319238 RepID=A0ABV2U018_9FLAO
MRKVINYKNMQHYFSLLFKGVRRSNIILNNIINNVLCKIMFYGNRVSHKNFHTNGLPYVMVAIDGNFEIGNNFRMNNNISSNPIGCIQPCIFFVDKKAKLVIGNNVNISQTTLVCHLNISIGDNVKLGGGVCIYDTDFHSLDPNLRVNAKLDQRHKVKQPININDNVFIGAHSIILKGVTIGENSIIGARSVVTKSVPANEIWGGNPAKKIKELVV